MRKFLPLFAASILVASCVPLEQLNFDGFGSSSFSGQSFSPSPPSLPSSPSSLPIDLPVEIEEFSSSSAPTGTHSTGSGQAGALAERMGERGILEIGNPDASLLLTVFTNYGCEYCDEFMRDMLPRLGNDFVAAGDLRVQLVIVPLKKYPNSVLESSALLCSTVMEKGQGMHEAIRSAKLPARPAGGRDRKSLLALAKKMELPIKQFTTCLDSKETKKLLADQQAFINDNTVTLIPTFMIGTDRITGLPSYADLRGWVREKLQ